MLGLRINEEKSRRSFQNFVNSSNVESNMYKLIFIHFILFITYCEPSFVAEGCIFVMDNWRRNLFSGLCGTDGNTYRDKYIFKCVQESQYGKRVNLQLSHNGSCFTWRLLWYTIRPYLMVSRLRTDLILIEHHSSLL